MRELKRELTTGKYLVVDVQGHTEEAFVPTSLQLATLLLAVERSVLMCAHTNLAMWSFWRVGAPPHIVFDSMTGVAYEKRIFADHFAPSTRWLTKAEGEAWYQGVYEEMCNRNVDAITSAIDRAATRTRE